MKFSKKLWPDYSLNFKMYVLKNGQINSYLLKCFQFLFQNCLGIIYTVWVENLGVPLETLVGNLVGGILVPPAGGPMVRFSIGAGDRQALQPPAAPPLPLTQTSVHMLLRLLGKLQRS